MPNKYDEKRQAEIVKLYQSGMSIAAIAKQLQAGKNSINRLLRDLGVCKEKNARKFTKEQEAEIAKEYELGSTTEELANKYGCSDDCIRFAIVRSGGEMRRTGIPYKYVSEDDLKKIKELWDQGLVKTTIGRLCGFEVYQMERILKSMGIDPNSRKHRGTAHYAYKGGHTNIHGYRVIPISPEDPYYCMTRGKGHKVLEHRYIMAKHLGRPLMDKEQVHHIDGDRSNNDISNLQLRQGNHGPGKVCRCADCGSTNVTYDEI